jgi:hypothetical protein
MNYKQKAQELVSMFLPYVLIDDNWDDNQYLQKRGNAKKCALKVVDEVLKAVSVNQVLYLTDMTYQIHYDYTKIKQEIEKL